LNSQKPDFCGISHFKGYFDSDTGTSAACPIAAGVIALLKETNKSLNTATAKNVLSNTAKQIGGLNGWNQFSGYGMIQAHSAYSATLNSEGNWLEPFLGIMMQNN